MSQDEKLQQAVEGIYNGTLADNIKQNIKYASTGIAIGAFAGLLFASFAGKCRICFAFWGSIAGGGIGYLAALPKKQLYE
mgnify:FL=1